MDTSTFVQVFLALLFLALRFIIPNKDPAPPAAAVLPRPVFLRYYLLAYALFLVSAAFFTWALRPIIGLAFDRSGEGVVHGLLPGTGLKWALCACAAIFLSVSGVFQLVRWRMEDLASVFWDRYDQLYGFQAKRVLVAIRTMVLLLGVLLFFVAGWLRFDVTEDGLLVRDLTIRETKHYTFDRMRTIEHVALHPPQSGDMVQGPCFRIGFDDGRTWTSKTWYRDAEDTDEAAFEYIRSRSGIPSRPDTDRVR